MRRARKISAPLRQRRSVSPALTAAYSNAVAGDAAEIAGEISAFTHHVDRCAGVLAIGLVVATLSQMRFGLWPLASFAAASPQSGQAEAEKLERTSPAEIVPLQDELNALLQSNRQIIERARTQVGNLAHALKTPLSVITNEAREPNGPSPRRSPSRPRSCGRRSTIISTAPGSRRGRT